MKSNSIEPKIENSWKDILYDDFNCESFRLLKQFLIQEKSKYRIYPKGDEIFNAFNLTPFNNVKVVILGQDPYHGEGQAHGLCFSVPNGVSHPPSLVNIFKELNSDLGIKIPKNGNLEKWAKNGVLLLNATLTVRQNQAGSHQKKGWEDFTDSVIKKISINHSGIVFLLWGNFAIAKEKIIDTEKHFILKSVHPSPLSAFRGFFGCHHFSKTNQILNSINKNEIDWSLE